MIASVNINTKNRFIIFDKNVKHNNKKLKINIFGFFFKILINGNKNFKLLM